MLRIGRTEHMSKKEGLNITGMTWVTYIRKQLKWGAIYETHYQKSPGEADTHDTFLENAKV